MTYDKNHSKPLCQEDCWHYAAFGGEEGCGQEYEGHGGWPEAVKPGDECLYPSKREICKPILITSSQGLCAALEGEIIEGGPHDNTLIAKILTNSEEKSD